MKIWFKSYVSEITGERYRYYPDFRIWKYADPYSRFGPFGTHTLGVKRAGRPLYSWLGLVLYSIEYNRAHRAEVKRRELGFAPLPLGLSRPKE